MPLDESLSAYRNRGGVVHRRDPFIKSRPAGLCELKGGIVSTVKTHVNCVRCRRKMKDKF